MLAEKGSVKSPAHAALLYSGVAMIDETWTIIIAAMAVSAALTIAILAIIKLFGPV